MVARSTLANILGYIALLFWAAAGVLATVVKPIPTFEVISIAFGISFTIVATKLTLFHQWHIIKQPWLLWIIGIAGVFGNDILYIAAFKYAPSAQVDLLNYLWPVLVVIFASMLPGEKFTVKHTIAAVFGFAGAYLLITGEQGFASFNINYLPGYLLALFDAIVWSVYCLVARHYKNIPTEMIGMYCGIGFVLSLLIHFNFEPNVTPNMHQLLVMIVMGLTTQGFAYFFWDFGIKNGNFKMLSIVSYGNPIIAIMLLIGFGMATSTPLLWDACILVSIGGLIGSEYCPNFGLDKIGRRLSSMVH